MKKCPFCAEEIQNEAIKCKHCNEMLTEDKTKEKKKTVVFTLICPRCNRSYDKSWKVCINCDIPLKEVNKEMTVEEAKEVRRTGLSIGKYSCPKCYSKFTKCERHIGCAVMIIIFISLGLGAIIIPFLPYHCECLECGHRWKS